MDSNRVADVVLTFLLTKHARVYRNEAPQNPIFPYVVFDVSQVDDTHPSYDYTVYVDVYEKPHVSVRAMTTLADTIDSSFLDKVITDSTLNLHVQSKNIRQFISNTDLISSQMINMQFNARVYFK
jgi:hypothetical protein